MICDHCAVLMNFNNCHVCSEVYDTLAANLSALFQTKNLQLILAESVDFKFKLFIKKSIVEKTHSHPELPTFSSAPILGVPMGLPFLEDKLIFQAKLRCLAESRQQHKSLNLSTVRTEGRTIQVGICFTDNQFLKHLERLHNGVYTYLYRKAPKKCLILCQKRQ